MGENLLIYYLFELTRHIMSVFLPSSFTYFLQLYFYDFGYCLVILRFVLLSVVSHGNSLNYSLLY